MSFCNQPDTDFHFSKTEFTELCDWLVHQDDDEVEAFWEEFSDALKTGDPAVGSLLRKIIPKTEGRILSFVRITGGDFILAIRRILFLS